MQVTAASGSTLTKLSPGGSASLTCTLSASEGPSLCTVRVNVTAPPAATVVGLADFAMLTFASSPTVTVSVSVLLAGLGSGAGPDTLAELDRVAGPASGARATVSVIVEFAPAANPEAWVQVTAWPAAEQLHPPPVPLT